MPINGLDETHEEEKKFKTASVQVNLVTADVLGREVVTEEDKEKFLAIISSFFSSEIIHKQLKEFVKTNM